MSRIDLLETFPEDAPTIGHAVIGWIESTMRSLVLRCAGITGGALRALMRRFDAR